MREYRFLTTWLIGAERERVFAAIWDSPGWPQWWRGVIAADEIEPGDEHGIGRRGSYEWRSTIPYPVRFEVVSTRVEPPWLLEGRASGGLVGTGRWRLFAQGDVTAVLYEWNVVPGKRWMRALGPLGAPLFRWNHDRIMRSGGIGLAARLGVPLLASS